MLTLLVQAGYGVSHLHATPPGICHRDIRRANVLVASRDPLRICITDFGLSHVLDAGGPSSTVTQIGPVGVCVRACVCVDVCVSVCAMCADVLECVCLSVCHPPSSQPGARLRPSPLSAASRR
ncbi:MAG: protein kinase [Terracidiphilus sp.]|nr:protein kinase [Terracidiphilus sp.]